jgi:dynein heavy chain
MALTDAEIAKDLEVGDRRVEFMAVYILRNFKIKPDRWIKMYNNDENKYTVLDFFDKIDNSVIVFSITPQGALMVSYLYPTQMKTKCIWFAKKNKGVIPKDEIMRKVLMYGELSLLPMEQFSVALEEVINIRLLLNLNFSSIKKFSKKDFISRFF